MSFRRQVMDALQSAFGFGTVAKSSGHGSYDIDGEVGEAVTPDCERWGDAAVLSRPPDGAEVAYMQIGDERIITGTRYVGGFAITLEKGEAVIRAMGAGSPAYVRLRPNGDVQIVANNVHVGAESVATYAARADKVDQEFQRIWQMFASWTPGVAPTIDNGAPLKSLATTASGLVQTTAATKLRTQ